MRLTRSICRPRFLRPTRRRMQPRGGTKRVRWRAENPNPLANSARECPQPRQEKVESIERLLRHTHRTAASSGPGSRAALAASRSSPLLPARSPHTPPERKQNTRLCPRNPRVLGSSALAPPPPPPPPPPPHRRLARGGPAPPLAGALSTHTTRKKTNARLCPRNPLVEIGNDTCVCVHVCVSL